MRAPEVAADTVTLMADVRPGAGVPIDPEKLKWVRNARLMTQAQLAEAIGQAAKEHNIRDTRGNLVTYTADAVGKLERGRKPQTRTFEAIVKALNCAPADLLVDFPGEGTPAY